MQPFIKAAIAYRQKDNRDNHGRPFIYDKGMTEKEAYIRWKQILANGYKDVICFRVKNDRPTTIEWNYVYENILYIVSKVPEKKG